MAWYVYVVIFVLLALSALFSGLTIGIMSLNPGDLRRKAHVGNPDAARLLPLRGQGNLVLCTLLLGNVAVNAALAIFLGSLASGVLAGFVATALIVLFGEIVPQAIFAKHALHLGAKASPLIYPFLFVFYPIAKPISLVLDSMLGGELPTLYSKREIHLLLQEHEQHKKHDIGEQELRIMQAGLVFSEKRAKDVMVPRKKVFTLAHDAVLDKRLLRTLKDLGYSRVPVEHGHPDNIVGVLYMKDLLLFHPLKKVMVEQVMRPGVLFIRDSDFLGKVLSRARTERIHLLIVQDEKKHVVGIVSLEDVLEEIIGEIDDEYDEES